MRYALAMLMSLVPAGVATAQAVPAHDSARVETVERLLEVTGAERLADSIQSGFMTEMLKGYPAMQRFAPIVRDFVARYGSAAALRQEIVQLYRETFSETELTALLQFYDSDLGQSVMHKLPTVMNRGMRLGTARIQEKLPELIAALQEAMAAPPQKREPPGD